MDFVIIANPWQDRVSNPTSKHHIAEELVKRGHRVLWLEGAGMRRPSLGSRADRGRVVRRIVAAFQGARLVCGENAGQGRGKSEIRNPKSETISKSENQMLKMRGEEKGQRNNSEGKIWVLSPLLIPLPAVGWIRSFNGWLYRTCARRWARRLGFKDPALINYVPVLAEAMRGWAGESQNAESRGAGQVRNLPRLSGVRNGGKGEDRGNPPVSSFQFPVSTVYYCVDRWDAFDMYDSRLMKMLDEKCCSYAHIVIASSRDLYDRCSRKHDNVHLITHGVNYDHFAQVVQSSPPEADPPVAEKFKVQPLHVSRCTRLRPFDKLRATARHALHDLPRGRIIGFFGLLSEWIDQDLLVRLARELPESHVVLIGKADVPTDRLEKEPNINMLGPRPFSELPAYVAHFDVGIIPFIVNDLTRAVNPIKLREMLAGGCPVVSTDIPEVAAYAGAVQSQKSKVESQGGTRQSGTPIRRPVVRSPAERDEVGSKVESRERGVAVGRDHEEFVALVREWVKNPFTPEESREISASVKGESWEVKVDQILEAVAEALRGIENRR